MKRIYIILSLILVLIFSGCSSGSNGISGLFGGSKTPEIDRTGDGLSVTFTTDDKFISVKQLDYTLILENTGLEPVILTRENFKLSTDVKMQDGSSVLDDTSVESFYNNIFKDQESITIYHDQKISGIIGSLFIKDDFFKKRTQEKFEYILELKYNYKTEFTNNLQIDFKSSNLVTILDSVSQAAPVKVTKIELSPISINEYAIKYYLKDAGQTSSNERNIKIKNLNIIFRTQTLSSCKGLIYKDNFYKEIPVESLVLNKENAEVIVTCKVDISDIDKTSKMTTTTTGSFEYVYSNNIKNSISLPKKSADQIVWEE